MKLLSRKLKLLLTIASLLAALVVLVVLWIHAVPVSVTEEDRTAADSLLKDLPAANEESTYDDQISFIAAVQDAVLKVAPVNKGIPFGESREPSDLIEAKQGLCFDRSRAIEKLLRSRGFEARHVFVLSKKDSPSALKSFFTPGVKSHAVTEVKTSRGWLVVDSNTRWMSLDADGSPVGMAGLTEASGPKGKIEWKEPPPEIYERIYPFVFIYGLYSRHGEFYPPYDPVPDVNYGELFYNFF